MSFRLWYRTYTEHVNLLPNVEAFGTFEEAQDYAAEYMTWHSSTKEQFIRDMEIQHVQCGEMYQHCECDADL